MTLGRPINNYLADTVYRAKIMLSSNACAHVSSYCTYITCTWCRYWISYCNNWVFRHPTFWQIILNLSLLTGCYSSTACRSDFWDLIFFAHFCKIFNFSVYKYNHYFFKIFNTSVYFGKIYSALFYFNISRTDLFVN